MAVMGVCPGCGAKFPLEAALQDARARQALAGALKIDARLADPLLSYLGLFSAADGRAARMDKLVRLITELAEPIARGQVSRNGITYGAPVDYWRQALEEVLARRDKLTLPLKGHGYLFEVCFGIASKATGQQERKAEERQSYRHNRPSSGAPVAVGEMVKKRGRPPENWKTEVFNKGKKDA